MKLLFEPNLSPRLIKHLADLYPGSSHVYLLGLDQSEDEEVWEFARHGGFLIMIKDADFSDLCLLFGFPPNVIWIRRGNCETAAIEAILRNHYEGRQGAGKRRGRGSVDSLLKSLFVDNQTSTLE